MNITRFAMVATLWAVALYGGLQLNRLELGHSICGPWGCGPPASALLAVHTGWLLAILPLAIVLPPLKPNWPWKRIGAALLIAAVLAVACVGIADHISWRQVAGDRAQEFAWQRFGFRIATLHGIPMLQLGLLGIAMTLWPRKKIAPPPADSDVTSDHDEKAVHA